MCLIILVCCSVGMGFCSMSWDYVHAFSCIVFSHYTSFSVVISLYCFLSFSLSLEHLPMAPKKSTPICNPISHASSSSTLVLNSLQFNDTNCWKAFKENFTLHQPHVERQIILSKLSNIAIPETFQSHGLEFLCEWLTTCLVVYVQEFYCNIYIVDTFVPMFTTSVQGTCISVTPKLISKLVHVPQVAESDHPNTPVLASLSLNAQATIFYGLPSTWGYTLSMVTCDFV